MKKIIIILFIFPIICICDVPWHTISFGILGNAGSATFHTERLFFGIDAQTISVNGILWIEEETYDDGEWYLQNEKNEMSISAWILTPRIGKRIDFKSSGNIYTYGDIEGYITIPFADISMDNDSVSSSDLNEAESILNDFLDFMGFKFSYGVNYQINSQLSLSTAVGYNYTMADFDLSTNNIEFSANLGSTFTKFAINYSF